MEPRTIAGPGPDRYSERTRLLHAELPVVDGHNDLPWRLRTLAAGAPAVIDPSGSLPDLHTDIPRMLAGGVGAQWRSVHVPADTPDAFAATIRQIELVEGIVAREDRLRSARTAADVRRIRGTGRIASLLGAEGGHSIEGSLDKLRRPAPPHRSVGLAMIPDIRRPGRGPVPRRPRLPIRDRSGPGSCRPPP